MLYACLYSCKLCVVLHVTIKYSGLFSLGVNFPEFPEWACDSGKLMLGCLYDSIVGLMLP